MACDERYFTLNVEKGVCDCFEGTTLFDKQCVPTINGCIAYTSVSGSNGCLFCNISARFLGPPTSDGRCECSAGFGLVNGLCVDVCGDGLIVNPSDAVCDDGNTIDGDGCSSTCKTEIHYRCVNGSDISPSACVYRGLFLNLTLKKTERVDGQNSGTFTFYVSPALMNLRRMDLTEYFTLDCESAYNVTSMAYDNGKL